VTIPGKSTPETAPDLFFPVNSIGLSRPRLVNKTNKQARGSLQVWSKTMYILNWKPESHLLEASLGGRLTSGEAECFLDEISEILRSNETAGIEVVLDFAAVSSMDANVSEVLNSVRDVAHFAGARVVTFVTRDDDEMTQFTNDRLQQVLEGAERYVAYRLAC